jgi:uncharacterized cupredoxin-like copper-binding protein
LTAFRLALASALIITVAACAGTTTTPQVGDESPATSASPGDLPAASPSADELVIDVALTDAMRIEPAPMTVRAGQPVRFVVTNTGAIAHEFFLGDEEAQAAHEEEMAHGGMAHDEPNGVFVEPGETKELVFTFAPGEWLAGCHVPGHYPAGMKAEINVQP